jgi:hypothetical protein
MEKDNAMGRVIDTIRADNTSGAAELARTAAIAVLSGQTDGIVPPHAWKKELLAFTPGLYIARPAMAAV